jgi:hypothetical protein
VLPRVHDTAVLLRNGLSEALALRWLKVGRFPMAAPLAACVIVWYSLDQLGRPVDGIPFWLAWPGLVLVLVAAGSIGYGPRARTPAAILFAQLIALWLLYDFLYMDRVHLYDLNVYLGSAQRWLDGGHAYLTAPLTSWPDGPRDDYFLYPPVLLPLFGLLTYLPAQLVGALWTTAMVAATYAAFRWLGLSRGWSLVMLFFPPVFIGFESGNVAGLTFMLFAAAFRFGGSLVVDTIYKVQAAVPVLWLFRERRVRGLIAGCAAVVGLVLITLPILTTSAWLEWWNGLGYRATSQLDVPVLFGYSYARWLTGTEYTLLCAFFVLLALPFRGRRGLAALGLASIFASPSLWPHGFAFALPAVLMLESDVAILAVLGIGSLGPNMWLLFLFGWFAILAAWREPAGDVHPVAANSGPWPAAQTDRASGTILGARRAAGRTQRPEARLEGVLDR